MLESYRKIFCFENKTVVVTGGAGLLGSEIVKCFCAFHASAVVADVNEKLGKLLVKEVCDQGARADFYFWDMSNVREIPKHVAYIYETFGPVDVWINSAYPRTAEWGKKMEDMSVEGWQKNVDMHLNGYCVTSNEIAKHMAARKDGVIVNIASIHSLVAPDFKVYEGTDMTSPAPYTAIKGGINMYSKYLASYYGKDNVRVNVVCPGGIFDNQPREFMDRYNARTLLKRMAKPEDIAPAVAFLASEAASYITGISLVVDGGLTAI